MATPIFYLSSAVVLNSVLLCARPVWRTILRVFVERRFRPKPRDTFATPWSGKGQRAFGGGSACPSNHILIRRFARGETSSPQYFRLGAGQRGSAVVMIRRPTATGAVPPRGNAPWFGREMTQLGKAFSRLGIRSSSRPARIKKRRQRAMTPTPMPSCPSPGWAVTGAQARELSGGPLKRAQRIEVCPPCGLATALKQPPLGGLPKAPGASAPRLCSREVFKPSGGFSVGRGWLTANGAGRFAGRDDFREAWQGPQRLARRQPRLRRGDQNGCAPRADHIRRPKKTAAASA